MIEAIDTRPDANVQLAEYKRLLGYPPDWPLSGRAKELAEQARTWYAQRGRPWIYACQSQCLEITNGSICIDGVPFASARMQDLLRQAGASSAILAAVSAGPELELEAARRWREEKPDEYFFLEVYGSAVVEHLITMLGARLCDQAARTGLAVLPHFSPGYADWDVSQQPRLLKLIRRNPQSVLPGDLNAMDSGMLQPKKSLLAVFGLTHHTDRVRQLADLSPCENCSFLACQFRRAPYRGNPLYSSATPLAEATQALSTLFSIERPLLRQATYKTNRKALARWAAERLAVTENPDGTTNALFRYEGKTCSNLGRPIFFDYRVRLGSRNSGFPICEQSCGPSSNDEGHRAMCDFIEDADGLMAAVESERPLLGQPLDRVLSWHCETSTAGCYCKRSDRMHKWRLVLETIHYALAERERRLKSNG